MLIYNHDTRQKVFIIAEIGINHNGDVGIAKELCDVAHQAGCDAVKIQVRNPDIATPKKQQRVHRTTPWGEMSYLEYKRHIELDWHEVQQVYAHSKLPVFASFWDVESAEMWLDVFADNECAKVPSAKNLELDVLDYCGWSFNNLIVSTGMTTDYEFRWLLSQIEKLKSDVALLHCISRYPCPNNKLNLKAIKFLENNINSMNLCEVGYSGHEVGLATTVAAVALGARIIERHITLDRTMWGTDQAASVEPVGLQKLVRDIRAVEDAMKGGGKIDLDHIELGDRKKLRGY